MKIDLLNQKFGRLTVIRKAGKTNQNAQLWECVCECGQHTFTTTARLRKGKTRSCGCLHLETLRTATYKHGGGGTRLYYSWYAMVDRCNNPKNKRFHRYGGRGISVCEEWEKDFSVFREWAMKNGYSDDLSIDRIDNDGNYEPSNCKWSTAKEQANNRSTNKKNRRFV